MGQCGTAVVGEGTELGVQRVIRSTGEGVVGRGEAAATVRVEVVAAVGNGGGPFGQGAIPARRAVGNDSVLERSVAIGHYATAAIAGEGGVGNRWRTTVGYAA